METLDTLTKPTLLARHVKSLAWLLCFAAVVTLRAQTGAGSIQGTVSDPSGAVIPGANVAVVNIETGNSLRTKSNSTGFFMFPSVRPGNIVSTRTLRASKNGRGSYNY